MGLDQFLFKANTDLSVEEIKAKREEFYNRKDLTMEQMVQEKEKFLKSIGYEEIGYWRKHPNLQGYCENLWYNRGNSEEFNCQYLELELKDINNIIELSENNSLPYTEGFFFGKSQLEDNELTIDIMTNALKEKLKGNRILYYSWW